MSNPHGGRYELEKALIEGKISVEELPALWNEVGRPSRAWPAASAFGTARSRCARLVHLLSEALIPQPGALEVDAEHPERSLACPAALPLPRAEDEELPGL